MNSDEFLALVERHGPMEARAHAETDSIVYDGDRCAYVIGPSDPLAKQLADAAPALAAAAIRLLRALATDHHVLNLDGEATVAVAYLRAALPQELRDV